MISSVISSLLFLAFTYCCFFMLSGLYLLQDLPIWQHLWYMLRFLFLVFIQKDIDRKKKVWQKLPGKMRDDHLSWINCPEIEHGITFSWYSNACLTVQVCPMCYPMIWTWFLFLFAYLILLIYPFWLKYWLPRKHFATIHASGFPIWLSFVLYSSFLLPTGV